MLAMYAFMHQAVSCWRSILFIFSQFSDDDYKYINQASGILSLALGKQSI